MSRWKVLPVLSFFVLPGCVGLPFMGGIGGGGGGGGGGALMCQDLGASGEAARIEAFLDASASFEANSLALAADVEGTCDAIAYDLGLEVPSAVEGQLQVDATCTAVAQEIALVLEAALPSGASLEVVHEAPVCELEIDAQASCVAECSGSASASADGGGAVAEADATCEAACEAEFSARAECTAPSVEVVMSVDVDPAAQARLAVLIASLETNLPDLLRAQAALEGAVESGALMVESFGDAVDAAGSLGMQASACFASSTLVAAESVATLEVTLSVTVEVSASASATAS